jgi:hypothetical protein
MFSGDIMCILAPPLPNCQPIFSWYIADEDLASESQRVRRYTLRRGYFAPAAYPEAQGWKPYHWTPKRWNPTKATNLQLQ